MKRSALRRTEMRTRSSPLKRAELKRSGNLRRVARMKTYTPKPAIKAKGRKTLGDRSGGWCEMRTALCTGSATEAAHRAGRGSGGRHGDAAAVNSRLSNYVHACHTCHAWTHEYPKSAELRGWILPKTDDVNAHLIPAWIAGLRVLLDDEGGWSPCES